MFVILAAVLAAVVIPTYALTVERSWAHLGPLAGDGTARRVLRTRRFWVLTGSFALLSFSLYAVTLSAVPAAVEKGLGSSDCVVGSRTHRSRPGSRASALPRDPALRRSLDCAARSAGRGLVLAGYAARRSPGGIFATAIIAGAVRGALTLVQASAVSDRWGPDSYGRLNGVLAGPVAGLTALAPGAAATVGGALGSYASWGS